VLGVLLRRSGKQASERRQTLERLWGLVIRVATGPVSRPSEIDPDTGCAASESSVKFSGPKKSAFCEKWLHSGLPMDLKHSIPNQYRANSAAADR